MKHQLVRIHVANKHGSVNADATKAVRFEWMLSEAMQRTKDGNDDWDEIVEVLRLLLDNCMHCRRLPKAMRTTYNYTRWTNGKVELENNKFLSFKKSLASEYHLYWNEWSSKVEMISISKDDDVLYELSIAFRKRVEDYEKMVAKYVELQKKMNNSRRGGHKRTDNSMSQSREEATRIRRDSRQNRKTIASISHLTPIPCAYRRTPGNKNNDNSASTGLDEGRESGNLEVSNCFRYGKLHGIQKLPVTEKQSNDVVLHPVTPRKAGSSGNEEREIGHRKGPKYRRVLALMNEEILTEFTEVYEKSLRVHRQQATKYVRAASKICGTFEKYPSLVKTMFKAYEEEKKKDWEVDGVRAPNRSMVDIGIREEKQKLVGLWTVQHHLARTLEYLQNPGYECVHNWVWIKTTQKGKMRGDLGRLFQRVHEGMYIFKHSDVTHGKNQVRALRKRKILLVERVEEGMKPSYFYGWIKEVMGESAVLLEMFARTCCLRKSWL
eukprot:augustus_masked-scaffold_46-processed-gene-0.6-mRNA-1 protein AED:1.00 eAED:1.00 QI:0/0/0/0/1/1/6/0/493